MPLKTSTMLTYIETSGPPILCPLQSCNAVTGYRYGVFRLKGKDASYWHHLCVQEHRAGDSVSLLRSGLVLDYAHDRRSFQDYHGSEDTYFPNLPGRWPSSSYGLVGVKAAPRLERVSSTHDPSCHQNYWSSGKSVPYDGKQPIFKAEPLFGLPAKTYCTAENRYKITIREHLNEAYASGKIWQWLQNLCPPW
jgi:hypothetical protein